MSARAVILMTMVVVFVPLWAYMARKWWRAFNSPDGERYRKLRMQGPFVPLDAEEINHRESRKP